MKLQSHELTLVPFNEDAPLGEFYEAIIDGDQVFFPELSRREYLVEIDWPLGIVYTDRGRWAIV